MLAKHQSDFDKDKMLQQQAHIIEELTADRGQEHELQKELDQLKQMTVPRDYLQQMVTRISTLLIQTERGVFKRPQ